MAEDVFSVPSKKIVGKNNATGGKQVDNHSNEFTLNNIHFQTHQKADYDIRGDEEISRFTYYNDDHYSNSKPESLIDRPNPNVLMTQYTSIQNDTPEYSNKNYKQSRTVHSGNKKSTHNKRRIAHNVLPKKPPNSSECIYNSIKPSFNSNQRVPVHQSKKMKIKPSHFHINDIQQKEEGKYFKTSPYGFTMKSSDLLSENIFSKDDDSKTTQIFESYSGKLNK